ncbi:hypothetical protein [Corynebacterium ulceribovis]|uniref:hypothetical protein n=1 Tax=Corynebacterium ulceribovis TaxID=487732 RepID=UPI00035D6836|nr:hypothetical protein [Corynebacterium ulceribovis]
MEPTTPEVDDRPTAVLPVASDRTGDQPTALQMKDKDKELGDVHQATDGSADGTSTPDSDESRTATQKPRKRRTRTEKPSGFGWRSQLIVMAVIYVVAIVLGVLLGLWLTNSMDTIPGVN